MKLALRRVKDPDLQLNIVDLGLVYGIRVDGDRRVRRHDAHVAGVSRRDPSSSKVSSARSARSQGVTDTKVNIVWAPFWTPDRIEPRVRAYLGL